MTERGKIKVSTRIYNGTIDACVMSKLSKRPGTKNSEEPDGRLSRDVVKGIGKYRVGGHGSCFLATSLIDIIFLLISLVFIVCFFH